MSKRTQALEAACTATGWYAYRDKDCDDRYLVGLPPKDEADLQETLSDIARPGGTIYGWDCIGSLDYVTAWILANPYNELYHADGSRRTEHAIIYPPRATAYAFTTVTVTDPITGNPVDVTMYLHPNGGVFGIDSAFLTNGDGSQFELADEDDGDSDIIIYDPFVNATGGENDIKVRCSEDAPEEYAPYYTAKATNNPDSDGVISAPKQATISAEVHSDNRLHEVDFDATPWFEQALDNEILDLAKIDFGGDQEADAVALFAEKTNPAIAALYAYTVTTQSTYCPQGYECSIDAQQAMDWIKVHRPHLHRKIEANQEAGSW